LQGFLGLLESIGHIAITSWVMNDLPSHSDHAQFQADFQFHRRQHVEVVFLGGSNFLLGGIHLHLPTTVRLSLARIPANERLTRYGRLMLAGWFEETGKLDPIGRQQRPPSNFALVIKQLGRGSDTEP
jgi:hypothetical protein